MKTTINPQRCYLLIAVFAFMAFNTPTYSQKVEIGVVSGTSNYFGDISGKSDKNASLSIDLQSQLSKTAFGTFLRYHLSDGMSLRLNAFYGQVSASDQMTCSEARKNRNLHFRSNIIEVSTQTEITLLKKDIFSKKNPHSNRANAHRSDINQTIKKYATGRQVAFYSFAGLGFFHFNPQAEYNGKWYDLQPLGTEGQGSATNEISNPKQEKYSLNQIVIPMGIGMYYKTAAGVKIGFEVGFRKTFTDYLDDVSDVYADPAEVEAANGPIAAALSNRTAEVTSSPTVLSNYTKGDKRGNPNSNDSYLFTMLTLSYTLGSK